jgi:glutamate---cysteine ligase / carboxylate-amine ligase
MAVSHEGHRICVSASVNSGARVIAASARSRESGEVAVSSTRSTTDQTVGAGDRARSSWSRWNGGLDQRYTLGVEEELMLLVPSDWSLAQSSDVVLAGLSDELSAHTSPETHAAVVELATGVHQHVDEAVAELALLRTRLSQELDALGLTVAAAGTHPLTVREETEVSGAVRYRALGDSLRVLARREPTMALHVHVGVPAAEDAIRVLNALRRRIPVLLALSANSPFWQGRDSGFASARTLIFQAFPRAGPPRFFADYGDYTDAVDALIAPGAIPDPSFLWWDVRLQPALGTVEVRVMDAQSTVREVAPLVALVQSLARLELEGEAPSAVPGPEVLAENRFLAARDGMHARLIDPTGRSLVPVRETLEALLADCRPHAAALGCAQALDRVPWLAAAGGADRQRALAAGPRGLADLVARLAGRFLARGELTAAEDQTQVNKYNTPTERSGPCAAGSHTPVPPS